MLQMKLAAALLSALAFLSLGTAAQEQQQEIASTAPLQLKIERPSSSSLALTSSIQPTDAEPDGYVRPVPQPPVEKQGPSFRPFRTVAASFNASTLGANAEFATPLFGTLNLRSSINIFAFNYPFTIDGVNYDGRLHLKSTGTTLDWFPLHRSFHISPGILYVKNSLSAPASVGPGQNFELGKQPFVNSVDDPVNGNSTVIVPRKIAPMLLLGFGNILPRTGKHLSFPVEFGAAYTGSPQISVSLNGTACTTEGCVSFAENADAQSALKQEVYKLNEDLKRIPVYPIFTMGAAYHF
jgi:hypothetical protein